MNNYKLNVVHIIKNIRCTRPLLKRSCLEKITNGFVWSRRLLSIIEAVAKRSTQSQQGHEDIDIFFTFEVLEDQ